MQNIELIASEQLKDFTLFLCKVKSSIILGVHAYCKLHNIYFTYSGSFQNGKIAVFKFYNLDATSYLIHSNAICALPDDNVEGFINQIKK